MPMDERQKEGSEKESDEDSVLFRTGSSRRASDPQTLLGVHGDEFVDTSIEQLRENAYDVENSGESSPSRLRFVLNGEVSTTDSEWMGNMGAAESEISESDGSSGDLKRESGLDSKEPTNPSNPNEKSSSEKLQGDQKVGKNVKRSNSSPLRTKKSKGGEFTSLEHGLDLLSQVKDVMSRGEDPEKALELALEASKSFEACENGKYSLELVSCLHITASIYCILGRASEAVSVLDRAIKIAAAENGPDHALATFSGHMQLGDTYSMLDRSENSVRCYKEGLEIQKQVLGEKDPRVGETYGYIAEAYVQALRLDEAEKLCKMALDIYRENDWQDHRLEEAKTRRLMALILEDKGDHKSALEHLVAASSAATATNRQAPLEVAYIDRSTGDVYLSLGECEKAISAYEKSLDQFKNLKSVNHPVIGSVLVRMADAFKHAGKLGRAKLYCEEAVRVYETAVPGVNPEEIARGFAEVAAVCESMNELDQATNLLHKALEILYNDDLLHRLTIAGIEGQIGVIHYMLGEYTVSYEFLKNATAKLRDAGKEESAPSGSGLNLMGMVCIHNGDLDKAAEHLEEATSIIEAEHGPDHPETLAAYGNLAVVYDAMERLEDAIGILEYVVTTKEEKPGMVDAELEEEKRRLEKLRDEAGRIQRRKIQNFRRNLNE